MAKINFAAEVKGSKVRVKKVDGVEYPVTEVTLELPVYDHRVGHLVGKTVEVELEGSGE